MSTDTKAAGAAANGYRSIVIAGWKPHLKNTLRGFFSATMPSGIVIHDLMLHEANGKRWIGLPARAYTDASGQQTYCRIVEFVDRTTADKFRDAVLSALDQHLAAVQR
jgi:hypothetical protein